MGISNRDYYRDDLPTGTSLGGFREDGAVKVIIVACVVVFFLQLATGNVDFAGQIHGGLTNWFALHLAGLREAQVWRVLTYGFCHANFQHLFFNMIGLWVFGRMVEAVHGSRETLGFFLAAVMASGLCQLGIDATRDVPTALIGASGGVYALTILAALHFPRQRMGILFLPFSIELRWLALIYLGLDVAGVLQGGGLVAHLAHLGGAAFGAAYHWFGWRIIPRRLGRFRLWQPRGSRPAKTRQVVGAEKTQVRLYQPPAESLDSEVDRILDKINREGRASLTPEEHQLLQHASERYRNRAGN